MRRTTPDIILLKTDFRFRAIDIVMGHTFQYLSNERRFMLSTTPYTDPTLVPIEDITLLSDQMEFNSTINSEEHKYVVEYGDFPAAPIVAELIKRTNGGHGFNNGLSSENDIEYQVEEERTSIRLSDLEGNVIRFVLPNRRIILYKPVNDEITNAVKGTVQLSGDSLHFSGINAEDQGNFEITWKLDFAEGIAASVQSLVEVIIQESASGKFD